MNMSNDEYIILDMLGGSIMTEERVKKEILSSAEMIFYSIQLGYVSMSSSPFWVKGHVKLLL